MRSLIIFVMINLGVYVQSSYSQNVGIGTNNPTEKLEVDGVVYSKQGGIKFPDNTIQTSAAFNAEALNAADNRQFIVMELECDGISIEGPYNSTGYSDDFQVIELEMNLEREIDVSTGGFGQIIRNPITLIKDIDEGTPQITSALTDNQLCNVILHLLYDNQGTVVEYYKTTLSNARIIKSKEVVVYKGNFQYAHMELIAFWPQEIIMEHIPTGKQSVFSF